MKLITTLNAIRAKFPCTAGWTKLLAHLGKTKADDEPLNILTVLESNGLDDALWCLRAVTGADREIRLYAVWCARQVQHLMTDQRSIDAIDVAERFANGEANEKELLVACVDARHATHDPAASEAAYAAHAVAFAAHAVAFAAYMADHVAAEVADHAVRKKKFVEMFQG